jgi:hypothetical protein
MVKTPALVLAANKVPGVQKTGSELEKTLDHQPQWQVPTRAGPEMIGDRALGGGRDTFLTHWLLCGKPRCLPLHARSSCACAACVSTEPVALKPGAGGLIKRIPSRSAALLREFSTPVSVSFQAATLLHQLSTFKCFHPHQPTLCIFFRI